MTDSSIKKEPFLPFGFNEECSYADTLSYPNGSKLFPVKLKRMKLGKENLLLDNLEVLPLNFCLLVQQKIMLLVRFKVVQQ